MGAGETAWTGIEPAMSLPLRYSRSTYILDYF